MPFIQNGAEGVISVLIMPMQATSRLTHLAMDGHVNEADMLQTALRRINAQLFREKPCWDQGATLVDASDR